MNFSKKNSYKCAINFETKLFFLLRKNSLASITKNKSGVKEQLCRQNVIQFSNSINNAELSLWLSRYFIFLQIFLPILLHHL